jgi:long-chain acyl-CoA synthetase
MVYGDRRPHLVALIVPEGEFVAAHQGDPAALTRAIGKAVDRVNADLSVIEKIRRFVLADEAFSVENEQLTPSLKIRRHVIGKVYGERLDALFKR